MRVIAGQFRGRRLDVPDGLATRPMTDRVKETLFNILGSRFDVPGQLPPIDVLDVFAGTGGLGIEALSRGARTCVFVESNRRALRALRNNLDELGLGDTARIRTDNAWTMRVPSSNDGFGLMFCDPPYRDVERPLRVVDLLERMAPALASNGVIVFRHERHVDFPLDQLRLLACEDQREYGQMRLMWLARPGPVCGPTEPA